MGGGDKNTNLFKITTLRHISYNKISEIRRVYGTIVIEEQEIKQEVIDLYNDFLTIDQRRSPKAK